MKFTSSDSEDLRNLEFEFQGDKSIILVGEGEMNHYQIPNDKKVMESQFMIMMIDGAYYLRDLSVIHPSKTKLDLSKEI